VLNRLLALAAAFAVGLWPLAPRVHLHETTDDHGHHAAVAHRHAEEHDHHAGVPRPGVRELDDAESVVTTLDPVLARVSCYGLDAPQLPAVALVNEPPASTRAVRAGFVERFNHGPPRAPTPLRGPPATHS
jgi:hypothetical protein